MRKLTSVTLVLLVMVTCIGCDQITKDFARENLTYGSRLTVVDDLVHLIYAENAGIAFGIGARLPDQVRFWLFVVGIVGVLVMIGAVAYVRRERGATFIGAITLILAGGASNLIDRVLNDGHVVDFVVLDVGGLRTIIFNLADVLVLCGAALLIASALHSAYETGRQKPRGSTVPRRERID